MKYSTNSCFSISVLLDHCNLGTLIVLPPYYIPSVLMLSLFFNKKLIITYQKKKTKIYSSKLVTDSDNVD